MPTTKKTVAKKATAVKKAPAKLALLLVSTFTPLAKDMV